MKMGTCHMIIRRNLREGSSSSSFSLKTTHILYFMRLESFSIIRVRLILILNLIVGINPKTEKVEQLPYEMMCKENKPKLYFKHKEILNQVQIEMPSFGLYLHENMLDFFTDINDIADCLDTYSLCDACESRVTYSYDVSNSKCK